MSGCLRCTYCRCELIEEMSQQTSSEDGGDTRSLMAKFNDQIEPIYALLKRVEDVRLSSDILEPEPADYRPVRSVCLRVTQTQIQRTVLMLLLTNRVVPCYTSSAASTCASDCCACHTHKHCWIDETDLLWQPAARLNFKVTFVIMLCTRQVSLE